MSIEEAEMLFTRKGFWTKVFPQMVACYLVVTGLGLFISGNFDPWTASLAAVVIVLALTGSQLLSYRKAVKSHQALKAEYGTEYLQLIERDEIRISAASILFFSEPQLSAERLLKSAKEAN